MYEARLRASKYAARGAQGPSTLRWRCITWRLVHTPRSVNACSEHAAANKYGICGHPCGFHPVDISAGSWDVAAAPTMTRRGNDEWEIVINERLDGASFKLAVCGESGSAEFEPCEGRTFSRFWGWPEASEGTVRLEFGDPAGTTVARGVPVSTSIQVCSEVDAAFLASGGEIKFHRVLGGRGLPHAAFFIIPAASMSRRCVMSLAPCRCHPR